MLPPVSFAVGVGLEVGVLTIAILVLEPCQQCKGVRDNTRLLTNRENASLNSETCSSVRESAYINHSKHPVAAHVCPTFTAAMNLGDLSHSPYRVVFIASGCRSVTADCQSSQRWKDQMWYKSVCVRCRTGEMQRFTQCFKGNEAVALTSGQSGLGAFPGLDSGGSKERLRCLLERAWARLVTSLSRGIGLRLFDGSRFMNCSSTAS